MCFVLKMLSALICHDCGYPTVLYLIIDLTIGTPWNHPQRSFRTNRRSLIDYFFLQKIGTILTHVVLTIYVINQFLNQFQWFTPLFRLFHQKIKYYFLLDARVRIIASTAHRLVVERSITFIFYRIIIK